MRRLQFISIAWFVLGIGSFLFHATQTVWGELMDELSMNVTVFGFALNMYDLHPFTHGKRSVMYYSILLLVLIGGSFLYIEGMQYEVFKMVYFCGMLIMSLTALTMPIVLNTGPKKLYAVLEKGRMEAKPNGKTVIPYEPSLWLPIRTCFGVFTSLSTVGLAYGIWLIDQKCVADGWGKYTSVPYELNWWYWMHPMWHCLTAWAAYQLIHTIIQARVHTFVYTPLMRNDRTGSFVPAKTANGKRSAVAGSNGDNSWHTYSLST